MAYLNSVLHVSDSDGNRVQTPDDDGDYSPEVLRIGEGITATPVKNGGIVEIRLEVVPAPSGVEAVYRSAETVHTHDNTPIYVPIYEFAAGDSGTVVLTGFLTWRELGEMNAFTVQGAVACDTEGNAAIIAGAKAYQPTTTSNTSRFFASAEGGIGGNSGDRKVYLKIVGAACFAGDWSFLVEVRKIDLPITLAI